MLKIFKFRLKGRVRNILSIFFVPYFVRNINEFEKKAIKVHYLFFITYFRFLNKIDFFSSNIC